MQPRENLALGQIVQLNLAQRVDRPGYWVPMSALARGVRGLWSAYLAVEDKGADAEADYVVKRTDVEVIQIESDRVLVRGTMNDGDRIIISGIQKLTVGQRVKLAATKSPSTDPAVEISQ
jgi:hypothetical protein